MLCEWLSLVINRPASIDTHMPDFVNNRMVDHWTQCSIRMINIWTLCSIRNIGIRHRDAIHKWSESFYNAWTDGPSSRAGGLARCIANKYSQRVVRSARNISPLSANIFRLLQILALVSVI
jgi:hypothetical protein